VWTTANRCKIEDKCEFENEQDEGEDRFEDVTNENLLE
jgi:hypothetical protein